MRRNEGDVKPLRVLCECLTLAEVRPVEAREATCAANLPQRR